MVLAANANWNAAIADPKQSPVFFLRIDGLSKDYSTAPVKAAGTTKVVLANEPKGGGSTVDLVTGTQTVQKVTVELLDLAEEITDLIATQATGAPLSTLVNRKATIYTGFRSLDEADYVAQFTGRIRGVSLSDANTFRFALSDVGYLLDGQIMTAATDKKPSAIRGNLVNLYASILRGTFSTSDPDFPLDFVSTATATSSAPTGLGIADSLLNFTQIKAERDTWHVGDDGHPVFSGPEDARQYLTAEFFRVFQAMPALSGDGLLGCRFHVPSLPLSAAPVITADHIVGKIEWELLFKDHLNKFRIDGDYSDLSRKYQTILYNESPTGDTTDQTNTGETIEYFARSKWLREDRDGPEIARELAGRMRIRFLSPPARVRMSVNAHHLNLEQGDVVAVTDADMPDLFVGTRGITSHMMTIISIRPDWTTGLMRLTLLDTGGKRYGLWSGDAQADFASATTLDKETYAFFTDDSGLMSDGSDGYRAT